jgi:hypothetical protein
MIKKQQKWIALLVTLTFIWLLQVSTMPVAAASTPEQIGSARSEQGPRFIEEEGGGGFHAKKKSILPMVLIGVGVAAVTAVLFLVVLKTTYDITGEWNYSWKNSGEANWKYTNQKIVFTGDKKTGTLTYLGNEGTYTVDGKNVSFQFNYGVTLTGVFATKDKISGTWAVDQDASNNGSFELLRVSTTAQTALPQTQGDVPGNKSDK